jgi:hypothetical protein
MDFEGVGPGRVGLIAEMVPILTNGNNVGATARDVFCEFVRNCCGEIAVVEPMNQTCCPVVNTSELFTTA